MKKLTKWFADCGAEYTEVDRNGSLTLYCVRRGRNVSWLVCFVQVCPDFMPSLHYGWEGGEHLPNELTEQRLRWTFKSEVDARKWFSLATTVCAGKINSKTEWAGFQQPRINPNDHI